MGRIKQGLDYFPINTNFMHDRVVRRVMKREGDTAFTILLYTLSYLYAGEGYYIQASDEFYDELADQLFDTDNDHVRRVIRLFVEYGFFDSNLYERYGILTSADIQQQFFFVARRRSRNRIAPEYRLLPEEEKTEPATATTESEEIADAACNEPDTATLSPDNAATSRDAATKTALIKRKEKNSIENILPNPPFEGGSEEGGGGSSSSSRKKGGRTQEDIDRMQPPADNCPRNFAGLLESLRLYRIPPSEQYAIVLKSNYGEIGNPVWKGLSILRSSAGKIKLPGHYLLSLFRK